MSGTSWNKNYESKFISSYNLAKLSVNCSSAQNKELRNWWWWGGVLFSKHLYDNIFFISVMTLITQW